VSGRHEPVLLAETLAFLRNGAGLYLDATVGDGGHAEALLDSDPGVRLFATDRDPGSLAAARDRLARFGARVSFAHATFRELPEAHRDAGGERFAGALLDLGLSSRQIDDPQRGISFAADGPLDLRMDPTRGTAAAARLADADADVVADVLRRLGDVGPARRLARAITAAARDGRLSSTRALAELVDRTWGGPPHPRNRARVFQALRMWVNEEREDLEAVLEWLPVAMRAGGIVVTLAYHSGEDRCIKYALRGRPETVSRRLPEPLRVASPWDELTRRVVVPSIDEVRANPRARSARLRSFRRRVS
jgi:16S rRNA (cytosine1402-N4)-methyltransferase